VGCTILILAGGDCEGWWGDRHLLPIAGEPLLARSVRLMRWRGYEPIMIANKPEILEMANSYFEPDDDKYILSTILSTQLLWDDRTIILFGDIIWSGTSLDTVLKDTQNLRFYPGYPAGVLGFSFDKEWQSEVKRQATHIIDDPRFDSPKRDGRRLVGHLHRAMCGFDVMDMASPREIDHPHQLKVRDSYTRDVDSPEAYRLFLEANPWARQD
jgi:hypothetical protein